MCSALGTALGHAAHDILAAEDEQYEQGHTDHTDGCHLEGIEGLALVPLAACGIEVRLDLVREAARHPVGDHLPVGSIDQARPYVTVPSADELEQGDTDKGRCGQRHHDLDKVAEVAQSVYLCCLIERVGDLHEVVSEQIYVVHAHEEGDDHDREGIFPVQLEHGQVVADGIQFAGDHHGSQHDSEECVFALEIHTGESVRRDYGDDDAYGRGEYTDNEGIDKYLPEGRTVAVCLSEHG